MHDVPQYRRRDLGSGDLGWIWVSRHAGKGAGFGLFVRAQKWPKTGHFWTPDWPDWLKMASFYRAPDGVDGGSRMTCFGLQNDPILTSFGSPN